MKTLLRLLLACALATVLGCAALLTWQRHPLGAPAAGGAAAAPPSAEQVARGAYLAAVGNCAGCHTARGGSRLAGGRAIPTPFGTVFSSNLTPDATGLAGWTPDDFWRALHFGLGADQRLLVPAHPLTNTTLVTRDDADALFAWLSTQPAVAAPRQPHELRWPYGTALAQAAWRALNFRPGVYEADPTRDATWNRGAYLTQGLAHCSACHAARNALGGDQGPADFRGGLLAGLGWTAPSLHDPAEGGVQRWPDATLQRWLRTGHAGPHSAVGPMAEVVLGSTSALNERDLAAMSAYLRQLPEHTVARGPATRPDPRRRDRGAALYREHCASCHGAEGQGRSDEAGAMAYPALAGSRMVALADATNLIRLIERGGFGPATAGHPQPYGMPPFAGVLDIDDLAALASHVRHSFGGGASELDAVDVVRLKSTAAGPR
ncbi:c-type cytochrome [Roseateles sp. BYS87W]|uniref:C-type cytochrome n=1 Tax=Pelomonas baiyunensis TaxID=3299026 RepID=A0ABW7H2Z7_9BURK